MTQLFTAGATGGTFADKLRTALDFAATARTKPGGGIDVPATLTDATAAPAPPPQLAADVPTAIAEPVASGSDDALAAAIRSTVDSVPAAVVDVPAAAPQVAAQVADVATEVAEVAPAKVRPAFRSWGAADIGALLGGSRRAATPVAEIATSVAADATRAAEVVGRKVRPGLVAELLDAAKLATKVR